MDRRGFLAAAAAALAGPDALARSLGGTPGALVTADLESHVVAVHLGSGRTLARIATSPGPRSIERVGNVAVVAHTASGALTLIDGPTLAVRWVIRGLHEPRYTAARHVSLDHTGRRLWTALGTRAARIAVVDVRQAASPRLLGRIRPPFLAHDVGFVSRSRRVWVTSGNRREAAVLDGRTGRAVVRLPAGSPPQHVTFLGERAYVTSGDDGTLRVQSARTGRVLGGSRIPAGSFNVQQGWGRVLTPSLTAGTLCVLDADGDPVHRVAVARSSHDACFVMAA